MALSLVRQGIETESLIGSEDTQVLLRAEAMVSGAGREAVKILMADAYLALGAVEVQADRVVLDGTDDAQPRGGYGWRDGENDRPSRRRGGACGCIL